MNPNPRKTVLLDTNVLIHEPDSIFGFPGQDVLIPISVLEEIDNLTKFANETSRNARKLLKELDRLKTANFAEQKASLPADSTLAIYPQSRIHPNLPRFSDTGKNSNQVLSAALEQLEKHGGQNFGLVSNDVNLRVRAAALGINAFPFGSLNENPRDTGTIKNLRLSESEIDTLLTEYEIDFEQDGLIANRHYSVEYRQPILTRYDLKRRKLRIIDDYSDGIWNLVPKNLEQKAAMDVLMDTEINLVILAGKAGTGKTLLAIASALEQMLKRKEYFKTLISRPIVPMGKDLGYLPGNIDEKMAPWMQPICDNLEFLTAGRGNGPNKENAGHWNRLIESGIIEIEALTYIRGRSIPNRYVIIDEAQNLTPHEVKTIVSRAGHRSKFVLTGDPFQIDNPYVDEHTNGLSYIREAMKNQPLAADVNLIKGERSDLAEIAANLL